MGLQHTELPRCICILRFWLPVNTSGTIKRSISWLQLSTANDLGGYLKMTPDSCRFLEYADLMVEEEIPETHVNGHQKLLVPWPSMQTKIADDFFLVESYICVTSFHNPLSVYLFFLSCLVFIDSLFLILTLPVSNPKLGSHFDFCTDTPCDHIFLTFLPLAAKHLSSCLYTLQCTVNEQTSICPSQHLSPLLIQTIVPWYFIENV